MRFFRALFLLLVLTNLGFFVWAKGYLGGQESGREPQRLAGQIAPEKLRIVTVAPSAATTATPSPPPAGLACRLVTGLPVAEVEAFKAELVGCSVEVKPAEGTASYWVNIPPQANKAAADKKAGELRALGIKDFYIVQDEGPSRNAISLGLFKGEAAAGDFLQGLSKRGVKSARIDVRETPPRHTRALVKGPAELLEQRLPGLVARMPGAATTECP